MTDHDEQFLSWVRDVTIKTIECMHQAEIDVQWDRPEVEGLAVLHKPFASLPHWYDLSPRDRLVQGLQGSLDPQYSRTQVLSDKGFEACFNHVFYDEDVEGGSLRVPFWETDNYTDDDITPLKSARAASHGDGWQDILFPWSSGRTAYNLHAIVRIAHKIGKGSPEVLTSDFPWHQLIAMLCYAVFRKGIQPPARRKEHTLSHWIRFSVLPRHAVVGMVALHFLDEAPSVPSELLRVPLGFPIEELELYRLMALTSFLTEEEISLWPTDPTLGLSLEWDAEPNRPTKFALENFVRFLARFSDPAQVGKSGYGVPRCLYAAGARSFSTIAAFESESAFLDAIKGTPYFQKLNQYYASADQYAAGLFNLPPVDSPSFWTELYHDAVNLISLNEVRAQQVVIDMKRYVYGSGISSIDLRDQKDRMEDIRNIMGLDLEEILGQIDDYTCEDCKSIFSPSAYLTELIRFLPSNARSALLQRRPDLDGLLLTCANTHVTLPYLDIVNEIMAEKVWQQYEKALGQNPNPFRSFNTDEDTEVEDLRGTPSNQLPTLSRLESVYTLPPFSVSDSSSTPIWNPSVRLPSVPLKSLPCDIGIREMQLLLDAIKMSRHDLISTFRDPFSHALAKSHDSAMLASGVSDWLDVADIEPNQLDEGQAKAIQRALTAEYLGMLPAEYLAVTQEGFWQLDYWNLQAGKSLGIITSDSNLGKALKPLPPVHYLWGFADKDAMSDLYSLEHGFIGRSGLSYDEYKALVKTHSIGRYNERETGNQLFKDNPYPFHSPFDVQYQLQFDDNEDTDAVFNGIQSFVRLKARTGISVVDLDVALTLWDGYDAVQGRIRPELVSKLACLKEISDMSGVGTSLLLLLWSDLYSTGDAGLIKGLFGNRNIRRIDAKFTEWIERTFYKDKAEDSTEESSKSLGDHIAAISAALGISQGGLLAIAGVAGLDLTTKEIVGGDPILIAAKTRVPIKIPIRPIPPTSSISDNAKLSTKNLSTLSRLVVLGRCFGVAPNQMGLLFDLFPNVLYNGSIDQTGSTLHQKPGRTLQCLRQWKRISEGGLSIDQVHALVQPSTSENNAATNTSGEMATLCFGISTQFLRLEQQFPSKIDSSVPLRHLEALLPHLLSQDSVMQVLAVIQGNATPLEITGDAYGIQAELESYSDDLIPNEKALSLYNYVLPFVLAQEKTAIISKALLEATEAPDTEMLEFGLQMIAGPEGTAESELDTLADAFSSPFEGTEGTWLGHFNPEGNGQYSFRFPTEQSGDVYIDDLSIGWMDAANRQETKPISLSAEKVHKVRLPSAPVELLSWARGTPRAVGSGARNTFLQSTTVDRVATTIQSLGRLFGPIIALSLTIDEVRFWKWHGEERIASGEEVNVSDSTSSDDEIPLPWGSRHAPVNFTELNVSSIEQLCEYASVKKKVTEGGETALNAGSMLSILKAGTQGTVYQISAEVAKLIGPEFDAGVVQILLRIYGGLDPRNSAAWDPSGAPEIDDIVDGPQSSVCNEHTMLQLLRALEPMNRLQVNNIEALKTILSVARPVSDELSWIKSTVMSINLSQLLRTRVDADEWNKTSLPVNDELRRQRRDAMVAVLLRDAELRAAGYTDADSLFEYFYLDVQMDTSLQTSRIKQAISTVHTFVQRAFLGLETGGTDENGKPIYFDEIDRTKWTWLSRYRVWEANRKVLAYPENYISAASLDKKTGPFRALEAALDKKSLSQDTVRRATREYLHSLSELSHLDYIAYDFSTRPASATGPGDSAPSKTVFKKVAMFARTKQQPWRYFYRQRDYYYGWSAWQLVELDVPISLTGDKSADGSWLVPFEHDNGRQLVFLPEVTRAFLTNSEEIQAITGTDVPTPAAAAPIGFDVRIHWSELVNGRWKPLKTFQNSTIRIDLSGKNVGEIITRLFFTTELIDGEDRVDIMVWGVDNVASNASGYSHFGTWSVFLNQMDASFVNHQAPENPSTQESGTFGLGGSTLPLVAFNTIHLSDTESRVIPTQLEPDQSIEDAAVQISKGPIDSYEPSMTIVDTEDVDKSVTEVLAVTKINKWLGASKRQDGDDLTGTFGVVSDPEKGASVSEFGGITSTEEPDGAYDFDIDSRPYSMYYWEIGLFIPMLAADKFLQNQQFDDALAAIQAIFDPRSPGTGVGQPNWKFAPFKAVAETSPQTLVESFRVFKPTGRHLEVWSDRPFQAHVFARARIQTYMSWVVMKYVEIFLAYGDFYFRQDTMESIPLAIQCYIEATQALGKRPLLFPRPKKPANTLIDIRNGSDTTGVEVILEVMKEVLSEPGADEYGNEERESWLGAKTLASTYFCMPQNPKLGQLRDTIDDRLFKIRHSMDINGNVRALALFQPAINPAAFVAAVAGGSLQLSNVLAELDAPLVNVRFARLVAKAEDICKFGLQHLGQLLLGNMEAKDANELANIVARQNRETEELKLVMTKIQLESAQQTREVLMAKRKNLEQQLRDYLALIGPHSGSKIPDENQGFLAIDTGISKEFDETDNTREDPTGFTRFTKLEAEGDALVNAIGEAKSDQAWNQMWCEFISAFMPEIGFEFGITVNYDLDNGIRSMGQFLWNDMQRQVEEDSAARDLKYLAAGRRERLRGWRMAANTLGHDMMELDRAVRVQDKLIEYASKEIGLQESNLASAVELETFQRTRTTNADFYGWMQRAVGDVYFQAYNIAYDLAKKAERAYFFEKGLSRDDDGVKPIIESYWDATNNGLLAGERLLAALHKLEEAFEETRGFDFEVTKKISLKKLAPNALEALKGGEHTITFELPEELFDRDFPGHYKRRIKTVSLTVRRSNDEADEDESSDLAATLTLASHKTRVSTSLDGGYPEGEGDSDVRFRREATPINSIAVSDADGGCGTLTFGAGADGGITGGYMPFEGAGVVSSWVLEVSEHTGYDVTGIEDVVVRMRPGAASAPATTTTSTTPAAPELGLSYLTHQDSSNNRLALNARNNAELRANAQKILSMIQDARPRNTLAAYEPKQQEFRSFCERKQYQDADTVTEDKLLLFLVEEVADRPLRAKSRKAGDDIPQEATRLAWRSVRSYTTAITDLYRTQKALGMNMHPSPREDNVREYLKSLQRRDAQQDKASYADKGRDTLG
ncbi:hypothetical protein DL764_004243 [Monosporascus ibericus]|uniref:PA14 domain-containing protein n=1 Tax=Monosporascus ibericus TaxID=155417 RepID=A0A4Q4TG55_9PEZI|nr:hypothetical protein DL764_004243 [Monosporascus ibericus]